MSSKQTRSTYMPTLQRCVYVDGEVRYVWMRGNGVPYEHCGDWFDSWEQALDHDRYFGRRTTLALAASSHEAYERRRMECRTERMRFVEQDP